MVQESSAERILAEWEETRQQVRKLHLRLQTAQEQLKLLERHPWLGSVKGVLRKKDGGAFDIPEGPRVARVSPPPGRTKGVGIPEGEDTPEADQIHPGEQEAKSRAPSVEDKEGSRGKKEKAADPPFRFYHFYAEANFHHPGSVKSFQCSCLKRLKTVLSRPTTTSKTLCFRVADRQLGEKSVQ